MAQDQLTLFANVACQCGHYLLSYGKTYHTGVSQGETQLMVMCGGCQMTFQMRLHELPSPADELRKALALASRTIPPHALHRLVDEAVCKDIMES
jgi:hypothetical protein